ncbi:MAG: 1-deoxy-D-xylulose-5-phosphate reductoisomerase [Clostridia bacterium]|nr:1-deoxy-D-xylulose-5-phosphate reductoisomerase [Clostridia bacterium]
MKKIALIGGTGSIGRQTLNVIRRYPEEFSLCSVSAHSDADGLSEIIKEFKPNTACIDLCGEKVDSSSSPSTTVITGENAYIDAVTDDADIVVVATVGFSGLKALLKCVEKGKTVALANKESLVVGGALVMPEIKKRGIDLRPVDSEHSAVWQALGFDFNKPFNKIVLTASGGAFRDKTAEELKTVTAKDALMHPNWNMGAKITVDCATLVNKAFEVIEARWLYDAGFDKIEAVMHRESIIHSLVEFADGSSIAQLSYPTMEIPIQLALDPTVRRVANVPMLDYKKLGALHFEEIKKKRFPCFDLVVEAGKKGGLYPAVANGANEVAVSAFLKGEIGFGDIFAIIDGALNAFDGGGDVSLPSLTFANEFSVEFAHKYIKKRV